MPRQRLAGGQGEGKEWGANGYIAAKAAPTSLPRREAVGPRDVQVYYPCSEGRVPLSRA